MRYGFVSPSEGTSLTMSRSGNRFNRTAGFVLVEALIAIVLVSLASVSTLTLLMFARSHNAQEQERARAHQIATERMDRLLHELFPKVEGGETITVWDNGTPDDSTDDTQGIISVSLRDVNGNSIVATPTPWERVEMEVTVTWRPRGRRGDIEVRESIMTYVAPHG